MGGAMCKSLRGPVEAPVSLLEKKLIDAVVAAKARKTEAVAQGRHHKQSFNSEYNMCLGPPAHLGLPAGTALAPADTIHLSSGMAPMPWRARSDA